MLGLPELLAKEPQVAVQSMPVLELPVTIDVNDCVPPGARVTLVGEIEIEMPDPTVTVAVADLVLSATLVATT